MKKTKLCLLLFLLLPSASSIAQEITEDNYLKVDSAIWKEYEAQMGAIQTFYHEHPEKKDSLAIASDEILKIADKKNMDAAVKYASTPSGLQRLFMVRLSFSKDSLSAILSSLSQQMQESPYGKSIKEHIQKEQIEVGDSAYNFEATRSDSTRFVLSSLKGKQILLLYGGLSCMGQEGRDELDAFYRQTSRKMFEVVVYWPCSSLAMLKEIREEFPSDYIFVSDFLQDRSPFKIIYGTQATPTCFVINKDNTVVFKSVGLDIKNINGIIKGK